MSGGYVPALDQGTTGSTVLILGREDRGEVGLSNGWPRETGDGGP